MPLFMASMASSNRATMRLRSLFLAGLSQPENRHRLDVEFGM
jgi:hypothetical protein